MANGETATKAIPLLASALGAAIGIGISYFTLIADVATLTERLASLQDQISTGTDDRYRGADARRDFALVQQQIQQNAHQIEELQNMLRDHARDKNHK